MIIQKPCRLSDPEHVVIPPTTSLRIRLEMDPHLKAHERLPDESTTKYEKNQPAISKQKATVICGFAAIGKSTFKTACEQGYGGVPVVDLDSSVFPKGPAWPQNYLEAIRKRLNEDCILMISTHKAIYSQLLDEDVDLVLVYPERELKDEWLERIRRREAAAGSGAAASICEVVSDRWHIWIKEYGEQKCEQYTMSEGEYLQDKVDKIIYHRQESLSKTYEYEVTED